MAPTVENPRIEKKYLRFEGEGDDREGFLCGKEDASMTCFAVTANHPIDGHEFGLAVNITEVVDELNEHQTATVLKALEGYLSDHPKGEA